ncbi:7351_t:CDS:2 [Diversispora eburnea]|uniref:7351_t:CDS:1 n=1 Tax=Diversispora eburnea TaxID=1213867 RepID=A0A9N8UVQ4_9GLOM|nr:7351_t:CDS:2 [Diversispora eburnea]
MWTLSGRPNSIIVDSATYNNDNSSWVERGQGTKYENANHVNTIPNTLEPPPEGISNIVLYLGDICGGFIQLQEQLNFSSMFVMVKDNISCSIQEQILNVENVSSLITGILFYSSNYAGKVPNNLENIDYKIEKPNLPTFYVSNKVADEIKKSIKNYNGSTNKNEIQAYVTMVPLQRSIASALQITFITILFTFLTAFAILACLQYGVTRWRRRGPNSPTPTTENTQHPVLDKDILESFPVKKFKSDNTKEEIMITVKDEKPMLIKDILRKKNRTSLVDNKDDNREIRINIIENINNKIPLNLEEEQIISTTSEKRERTSTVLYQSSPKDSLPSISPDIHVKEKDMSHHKIQELQTTCAICIEEFQDDELLRVLPCEHEFHAKCIDEWLTTKSSKCPLCKFDLTPTTSFDQPSLTTTPSL